MLRAAALAGALSVAMVVSGAQSAQRQVADTFLATTTNMTPDGLALRIQILEWPEADALAPVVDALAGDAAAIPAALKDLPTVGYLWPTGSPVGYSLKYAARMQQPDGTQRITLVTDKRVGSYDFRGWSVAGETAENKTPYSVIELYVDSAGNGSGNMSLATDVVVDEATGTVSLAPGGNAGRLLTGVKREPSKS